MKVSTTQAALQVSKDLAEITPNQWLVLMHSHHLRRLLRTLKVLS